ncbi:MAG: SagB family peptide dehydrogenase [Gaiellaceae bacterium MAG52_C11]|nr:SagB family peptide dehydrogenase [Candidatus Gaiellasilicea maunaloa]
MNPKTPTAEFASVVYGDGVALDDPAETLHEATKLYPSSGLRQSRGILLMESHAELRQSVGRAGHRYLHRPRILLPPPRRPRGSLARAIEERCSQRPAPGSTIDLPTLAAVLGAANGLRSGEPARRTIPSGGALYPLELYVLSLRLEATPRGVYHFDPHDSCLEQLTGDVAGIERELVEPAIGENSAAILAVTGVFWRTRFKYGLRAYRFTLLEAGHAVQNALLTAGALGLAALPLGGFYDSRIEAVLGVDGVHESVLYLVALGERAR